MPNQFIVVICSCKAYRLIPASYVRSFFMVNLPFRSGYTPRLKSLVFYEQNPQERLNNMNYRAKRNILVSYAPQSCGNFISLQYWNSQRSSLFSNAGHLVQYDIKKVWQIHCFPAGLNSWHYICGPFFWGNVCKFMDGKMWFYRLVSNIT